MQLNISSLSIEYNYHVHADCQELVQSSLIIVGEIGGNDYNHAFLAGVSKEVIQTFVAPVVDAIASTINVRT